MDHPPLALLTNGLLGAFNELRHCAPLSLRDPVAEIVQVWRAAPLLAVPISMQDSQSPALLHSAGACGVAAEGQCSSHC